MLLVTRTGPGGHTVRAAGTEGVLGMQLEGVARLQPPHPWGYSLPLLFLSLSRAVVKASRVSRSSAARTRHGMKRGMCRRDCVSPATEPSSAGAENGHRL